MSMSYELMMRNKDRKMPSNYELVEYIESTGTQYIQTDIIANNETGMQLDVDVPQTTEDTIMIGSRPTYSGDNRFYIGKSLTWYLAWNTLGNRNRDSTGRLVCSINFYNNRKTYLKNADLDVITSELSPQTSAIAIFGANIAGTVQYLTKIKLYSAQITQGNKLVRNFIPVYDTLTNKYGMWESVQGKFYGNDGTGDFKGSIVGYTVVGSPTITDGILIAPTDKENTIQTAEALDVGDGSFEMQFCILNPTVKGTNLFRVNNNASTRCTTTNTNTFNLYPDYQTDSSVVLRALSTFWNDAINNSEQKVYLRIKCTGKDNNNEYPFIFSGSTDGITWQTDTVISSLPLATGVIMYCSSYASHPTGYAVGYDLDLKETWIKKGDKLWFNGQEA